VNASDKKQPRTESVDESMNRVLAAERDARLAVAECRAEAARLVAAAEGQARALAGRSEARIKSAQRIADAAIARALAELAEIPPVQDLAGVSGDMAPPTATAEPLTRAIEILIGEIIGGAA
jgi:regulator of protease activity HflC (stomatin/prohibitin superfamily)